jgi:hypothetical protein
VSGDVSFSRHLLPIMVARCSFDGCHGKGAARMLQFNGGSGGAYDELMEKSSRSPLCSGAVRVAPGNPDRSLLVAKLKGTQAAICPRVDPTSNVRMPKPLGDEAPSYLPDEQIKLFEEWVRQGAKNN